MMKGKPLKFLIGIEIIILFFLVFIFLKNGGRAVQGVSVSAIKEEDIVYSSESIKHFFEYKESQTIEKDVGRNNTNGPTVPIYKINNDGLNQVSEYAVPKPNGVFRIVAIGDSFTFGENVHTEDNYPSQLSDLLKNQCSGNFQVLNLGIGGYDLQYSVERYRIRGQKYKPDLILWLIIEDDLYRINELLKPKTGEYDKEMKQTGEYEREVAKGNFFPGWVKAQKEMISEIGIENLLKIQLNFMKEINKYYSDNLVVYTFPYTEKKNMDVLKEFVNSRPKTYFSSQLPEIYSIKGASLPDQHPSPLGHKLIVEKMFEFLKRNNLIPC